MVISNKESHDPLQREVRSLAQLVKSRVKKRMDSVHTPNAIIRKLDTASY